MPTVKTDQKSVTGRKDAGDAVIAAAKTQDTKKVRAQLAAFTKAHGAYALALTKVSAAESVRDLAQRAVGEADAAQDAAIEDLARVLVSEKASRQSPLKGLTKYSVSDLKNLAVAKEAAEAQKIVAALNKREKPSKELKRVTKELAASSAAVLKAITSVTPREKLYQDTLNARDALGQPWETTLAYLKRAVRVAEDNGATGLFAALFQRTATAPKKKPATAAKTKKPAPTP